MRYARVFLDRSESIKLEIEVAAWEVPVLAAVNGEEACQVLGYLDTDAETPDAAVEYDRLATKYKDNVANGTPWVVLVYGPGQRGVAALRKEMESTVAEPVASKTPTGGETPAKPSDEELFADLGIETAPGTAEGAVSISE